MTLRRLVHVNKLFTYTLNVEPQCSSATFPVIYQTEWRLQSKGLRGFQNKELERNVDRKNSKYQGDVQKFRNLRHSPNIIRVKRTRWTGHVARMTESTKPRNVISENKM
jgi:hypothetical protein